MVNKILILIIAASLTGCASSGPEVAEATTAEAKVAEGGEPVAENKKEDSDIVCRREQKTGTKFFREVCLPRSAIENRAEQDKAALRQMRSIRSGSQSDIGN